MSRGQRDIKMKNRWRETNKRTYKGSVIREAQKCKQNYIQKQLGHKAEKI